MSVTLADTGSSELLVCILVHARFTPALDHVLLREDSTAVDLASLATLVAAAAALVLLTKGRLGYDADTQARERAVIAPQPLTVKGPS